MNSSYKDSLIACYSLDGNLIRTYPSCRAASKSLHIFSRTIDKAIREGSIIHEKMWRRFPKENVPSKIEGYSKPKINRLNKPICMIDENNKVIKTYPSLRRASIIEGCDTHTIRDVLVGKTKTAKGKKYRYLKEDELEEFGYKKE